MNAKQNEMMPEIESHIAERPKVKRRTIITRKRYGKQLIVTMIVNLAFIFIMPALFGQPWFSVRPRLMGIVTVGIYFWWTWSNWPTNIDDDQELLD